MKHVLYRPNIGLKVSWDFNPIRTTLELHSNTPFIIQQYGDWYTGRWWVGCYIWYSEDWHGRAVTPPSSSSFRNVTAHPSTASIPTSYYSMWHCNCLWILKVNMPQTTAGEVLFLDASSYLLITVFVSLCVCLSVSLSVCLSVCLFVCSWLDFVGMFTGKRIQMSSWLDWQWWLNDTVKFSEKLGQN